MRTKIVKLKKLNWFSSPSRALPHGLTGIISIVSGIKLVVRSLTGDLDVYSLTVNFSTTSAHEGSASSIMNMIPLTLLIYATSTFANAMTGFRISHLAPLDGRDIFKSCAFLQICLSYYVLRFTPHFSAVFSFLTQWEEDDNLKTATILGGMVRLVDVAFALVTMVCILSFNIVAKDQWLKGSRVLGISVGFGTLGILLLTTYPLQLAIQGQEWWSCVQDRYPYQSSGMVAYIYLPATITFSLILFSATLFQRKIMSEIEFGIGLGAIILVCLLAAVLSQELFIPDASTQRIYLPCHEPKIGTLQYDIVKTLDFSRYARRLLKMVLNADFETDLYPNDQANPRDALLDNTCT